MKNYDELTLAAGVERESIRIALSEQHRRRLNDFVETFVRPEQLRYFDGPTEYAYEYVQFSGISRAGSLVHVRHRKRLPGDQQDDRLTVVVYGSLDHDEVVTIHDTHSESRSNYDGTNTQRILLGVTEPEESARLRLDQSVDMDQLTAMLEEYDDLGTTPYLTYAHGCWTYHRHDGQNEPMNDLLQVHKEVQAVARKLGAAAIPSLTVVQGEANDTGHFDQKVVA
jgi:hypothetical protein